MKPVERQHRDDLRTLHDALQPLLVQPAIDTQNDPVIAVKIMRPLLPDASVAGVHVAADEEQSLAVHCEPDCPRPCWLQGLKLNCASISQKTPVIRGRSELSGGEWAA